MKLSEIKKLSKKEFAERYPFVQIRQWDRDTRTNKLCFYEEDDEYGNKKGDPYLEFYINDWYGWSDILLCWAEKVKPIYDALSKENQEKFYIEQLKEKYGDMRLYTSVSNEQIERYTDMVEHLSTYTCMQCGHLSKSSDGKKLLTWRTRGGWVSYQCKSCAKKFMYKDIKEYGKKPGWTNKEIFNCEYRKEEGDWFHRATRYFPDGNKESIKIDCRELLERMY